MTYRLPYAVAGRASHGVDVHAGHSPRSGGPRGLPPGRLGLRVVHFWPIRPDGRTSLPFVAQLEICLDFLKIRTSTKTPPFSPATNHVYFLRVGFRTDLPSYLVSMH